jgi:hypothetical protein
MSLVNLRFSKAGLFWDIRAATLEEQVLIPIQSRVEMGQSLETLASVMGKDDRYPSLFEKAFGQPGITSDRIAKALAQFLRSMVSYRSRYDTGLAAVDEAADDFPNFTAAENLGKTVFLERCAICHSDGRGSQSAFFSMFSTLNNGIDRTGSEPDAGRGDVTLVPSDVGLFKPSDLRNVEYTAPYMHDGRFQTLEQVVEHYSSGVNRHPNVSSFVFRMHFSPQEKAALVAFLKALSDPAFLSDPRFSDPWQGQPKRAELSPRVADVSAAVPAARPALPRLTRDERAQYLARGQGLPVGETLPWLRSLDADRDGVLSRDETTPLAKLVQQNGGPPRFDRRRFAAGSLSIARGADGQPALMVYDKNKDKRLTRDEIPESRRHLLDVGDSDGNGRLSPEEAGAVEAIERFIVLRANGRDQARVERLIRSLKLDNARSQDLNEALQRAKASHEQSMAARDAELVTKLEALMGADAFAAFQLAMLAKQDSREVSREGAESEQDRIFEFDRDRDGCLNSGEQAALAVVLEETPGGFGTAKGPLPGVKQFADRMMARDKNQDGLVETHEIPERIRAVIMPADADGDGVLSPNELDRYLRRTGFERLVGEGIYAGGWFINAFSRASRLLQGLDLSPEAAREAPKLLDAHDRWIQDSITETVVSAIRLLRKARPGRTDGASVTAP